MLQGFFDFENPVWKQIGRLSDMILLNILFIICSLPVFTLGVSLTAVYYCTIKIVRNEEYGDVKMFFHSFRENFAQGVKIWLILLPILVILSGDLYFFSFVFEGTVPVRIIFQGITVLFLIIWTFTFLYVFPLLSRFDNSVKNTLRNAILFSFRFLGSTVSMLVTDLLIIFIVYILMFYLPAMAGFLLLLGVPFIAWINSGVFNNIFQKFMKEDS